MALIDLQVDNSNDFNVPGGSTDRAMSGPDVNDLDPLVQLGLVDPKSGAALPTDDWKPEAPTSSPTTVAGAPSQPQSVAPGAMPQTTVNTPAQPDPSQTFQLTAATLQAQAAQAYAEAVGRGADPQIAEQLIGARLEAELVKARASTLEQSMLPTAKQQVATLVASRLGAGQVRAEELLVYDTPQAMEAAASQLAAARRAGNYQQRVTNGTDRTESGGTPRGIGPALDGLSPQKKIELGIRRGQFR